MRRLNARQLAREKSLFRYSSALERADFATVEAVLHEAERDPELAQMITEINMVYESEAIRLSPSLNHSSNHREKELLMTTIVLPQRKQPALQRWLPVTLAAACVSVLFIGALLMRPIRPNGNALTGMQASATATPIPTALPTIVPTSTPLGASSAAGMPPTVVPPENALVMTTDCNIFRIIIEEVSVYAQPADQTLVLGRVPAGMLAQTLAEVSAAGNDGSSSKIQWIFIKADVRGNSVQGWIPSDKTQPACQNGAVTLTAGNVPQQIDAIPAPTMIPPSDITLAPADFTAPVQIASASLPTSVCHLTNETANMVSIYAAPLTINSNAAVVGQLAPNNGAVILYANNDPQSAPVGAVWYLIMTNAPSAQQVTGWVSANSVTTAAGTPCAVDVTGASGGSSVIVTGEQAGSVSVNVPAQAAGETCQIKNVTDNAATMFAAALTNDSNAPVVGTFPAGSTASVILQKYDRQSDPIGALWYLIKVDSDQPVIGWVSANSIGASDACGLTDGAGVVVPTFVPPAAAGGVSIIGSTDAVAASAGICHVINQQPESIQVFSGPSRDGSEAAYVNNLPPDTPATVLYQQRNKQTGELWYLVLTVMEQEKQISGWVSADTVKVMDQCPDVP